MGKNDISCVACCKLEALVSVDERGQMILPKEVREKAQIKTGDKLVVASCEKDGKIDCLFLLKADQLKDSLKKAFGPLLEELLR
jgi:antitoxin PrlF